jgi:hypothetical protein
MVPLVWAVLILMAIAPVSATEGIESLKITINENYSMFPGENFQISFTIYKPLNFGPLNGEMYLEIRDPSISQTLYSKPYQEVPSGSDNYVENKTEYALNGVLNLDAPVNGLIVETLVYWKIRLDNVYSPAHLVPGDNLTVRINGIEYSTKVVKTERVRENIRYYARISYAKGDVYVSEDEPNYLYVTAYDYYTNSTGDPIPSTPPWYIIPVIIIGAVAIAVGLVLLKRRLGLEHVARRGK